MVNPDFYFLFEGRTYTAPPNIREEGGLVVFPDGRVFDISGWTGDPPQPTRYRPYRHTFKAQLRPAALARSLQAAYARPFMWGVQGRFLMIMEWAGVWDGDNWYLGKQGSLSFIGGNYTKMSEALKANIATNVGFEPKENFSFGVMIEEVIVFRNFRSEDYRVVITDRTAIMLYLEKYLTVDDMLRSEEVDGEIRLKLSFCNEDFQVTIRHSLEGDRPFDVEPIG